LEHFYGILPSPQKKTTTFRRQSVDANIWVSIDDCLVTGQ
jgi:hypothetical protein